MLRVGKNQCEHQVYASICLLRQLSVFEFPNGKQSFKGSHLVSGRCIFKEKKAKKKNPKKTKRNKWFREQRLRCRSPPPPKPTGGHLCRSQLVNIGRAVLPQTQPHARVCAHRQGKPRAARARWGGGGAKTCGEGRERRGEWGRRGIRHLPAGSSSAGTRAALLCGPGQLRSGSALVSKFPCREHLAMIIISTISVKYNIIRAY